MIWLGFGLASAPVVAGPGAAGLWWVASRNGGALVEASPAAPAAPVVTAGNGSATVQE